jgi:hypothetical protein
MESSFMDGLRLIDGNKVALHLDTRAEYERAFPFFFRAVGHEACARLWRRFRDATAHVGEDCRREAAARYPHLDRLSLDWVAFAFRGIAMWDLHIGVVADFASQPATIQVGVHTTPLLWPRLQPALEALDWHALAGNRLTFKDSRAVAELQLVEPPRVLDLSNLAAEAQGVAARVTRYYEIVAPIPAQVGIVPS